jgi:putative ABC transport system permease protein
VAATIIGSVLYLQAIERTRDFAVFKATGTSTAAIGAGLALQAVVLSLAAAVLAAIIGVIIAPFFPMHVEIPASGFVMLPVVTVVVGLLASLIALRRSVSVEPALAFGG